VLLLGYTNGYQVWDVQNLDDIREILSKKEIESTKFLKVHTLTSNQKVLSQPGGK
jgi:hypothetical protein